MDPRNRDNQRKCGSCNEPAGFLTPVGTFCGTHAIEETLRQSDSEDHWIPVPLVLQVVGEADSN